MPKQVAGLWIPDEVHLIPYLERGPRFAGDGDYLMSW